MQLRREVAAVDGTLVRTTWEFPACGLHHYHLTLHAYMMAVFSRLDLYSQLWDGGTTKSQTARMRSFLNRYLPRDPLADALAVELWRHTLMHTSRPRRLRDKATGREYRYLLQWGAKELPYDQHYQVESGTKLNLSLQGLLEDWSALLEAYTGEVSRSAELQRKAMKTWPKIEVQEFNLLPRTPELGEAAHA